MTHRVVQRFFLTSSTVTNPIFVNTYNRGQGQQSTKCPLIRLFCPIIHDKHVSINYKPNENSEKKSSKERQRIHKWNFLAHFRIKTDPKVKNTSLRYLKRIKIWYNFEKVLHKRANSDGRHTYWLAVQRKSSDFEEVFEKRTNVRRKSKFKYAKSFLKYPSLLCEDTFEIPPFGTSSLSFSIWSFFITTVLNIFVSGLSIACI